MQFILFSTPKIFFRAVFYERYFTKALPGKAVLLNLNFKTQSLLF